MRPLEPDILTIRLRRNYRPIFTKFVDGKVAHGPRKMKSDYGGDPDLDLQEVFEEILPFQQFASRQ